MPLTYTPLSLKAIDLTDPGKLQVFQQQLCDFLNAAFMASNLSGILNGTTLVQGSALVFKNQSFVNVSTNQSFDCTGAVSVAVYMSINTAVNLTLTLNNLAIGVPVVVTFDNQAAGAQTFKLACNTPTPTAYTIRAIQAGGGAVDLTATGVAPNAGNRAVFVAAGTPGPRLFGILQS